ncbi:MAG TPA: SRPBCC family protein [Panacibacter sp.]|nr:SRPBCC family protein [Panacibacter sp.]
MTVLIIILIIIAIPLIVALFTKKEYAVEREIIISKPKLQVFNYIKFLKNQNNYSVWNMKDPGMKQEFKGTDGAIGFTSAWDSKDKNVGKGEQEIKKITESESIDLSLHFIKPFEGLADARMATLFVSENETKVTWGFRSKMKYPMNIMLLIMNMDKMLGKDLATGLENLKRELEKQ